MEKIHKSVCSKGVYVWKGCEHRGYKAQCLLIKGLVGCPHSVVWYLPSTCFIAIALHSIALKKKKKPGDSKLPVAPLTEAWSMGRECPSTSILPSLLVVLESPLSELGTRPPRVCAPSLPCSWARQVTEFQPVGCGQK